jgi:acyl transferase domain-containing protein
MTAIAEPIAIIGFANRFPDEADTTEGLWRFLLKARSAFSSYPEDRIGPGHYHPDPNHRGSHAVQGAHFLAEDPALFDAPFFNITKNEVAALDPQQRLVLENVHHGKLLTPSPSPPRRLSKLLRALACPGRHCLDS